MGEVDFFDDLVAADGRPVELDPAVFGVAVAEAEGVVAVLEFVCGGGEPDGVEGAVDAQEHGLVVVVRFG